MLSRRLFLGLASVVTLAVSPAQAADQKLPVVATISIIADFAHVVGGDRVAVKSLVGPNGDAHVYDPSPADAKELAAAKLVLTNGLNLEGWMDRLIKASGTEAPIIVTTKGVVPRQMEAEEEAGAKQPDTADAPKMMTDPHAWQSIANAKLYVENIRDAFVAADPDGKSSYDANTDAYLGKLTELEGRVKAAFAALPESQRRVITTHDAFGYFGAAYGIEFIAPQGISTDSEATAKKVGQLIKQIRSEKIRAVFIENMTDGRLINRIAQETGVKLGGELFSDALSPANGPAATYISMIEHNVKLLTAAMAGS
ncbi:MAG: metal ABC transporter substrate-binding protein [Ancalomicrobiaceae bacterium]|nr:metal ABC transporter substrate-binding protein [Ancalomicrobiaceae bacterium]